MERTVALKKLRKRLGPKMGYRVDLKAASPEDKAAARAERPAAVAMKEDAGKRLEARRQAVLAGDAEYQALMAEWKQAKDRLEKISSKLYHDKITVGVDEGLFFLVKASGASWEEVIEKVMKAPA
jgi:hypothetical protein